MPHHHETNIIPRDKTTLLDALNGGLGLLSWRVIVLMFGLFGSIFLALLYYEGKNMGFRFVEQSPAVMANAVGVEQARAAILVARAMAETANQKADQSLTVQSKIFDAIKQTHDDIENLKVSVAGSSATVTAQMSSLSKQVDRIESKQDSSSH